VENDKPGPPVELIRAPPIVVMNRILALLALLVLPAWLLAQPRPELWPRPLALNHVTVIDATGAEAQPDLTVVISQGRLAALGKAGKVRVPKEAQVVDASGKFLIPGLWDMHVHTWMFELDRLLASPAEQALARETARSWNREIFFPLWLAHGVTGVRDMGGDLELIKQWRQEIAEGQVLGPRLIAAGPFVDGPKPVSLTYTIAIADEDIGEVLSCPPFGQDSCHPFRSSHAHFDQLDIGKIFLELLEHKFLTGISIKDDFPLLFSRAENFLPFFTPVGCSHDWKGECDKQEIS